MQSVLVYLAISGGMVCALMALAYLSACAGAGRWLTFREWWGA